VKIQSIPEGKFQINWEGKDGSGKLLSNGFYFYTIQGENGGSKTGKVVLSC
jgi:flagellar hook assembly protein FlgD